MPAMDFGTNTLLWMILAVLVYIANMLRRADEARVEEEVQREMARTRVEREQFDP